MAEIHYQTVEGSSWFNNKVKEEMADWMLEEARRLDLTSIIQMLSVVGSWDEQVQSLQEQGYLIGDNTSYPQDLS